MPHFDYQAIISEVMTSDPFLATDWLEWRACFEGGNKFREVYLEKFSDREKKAEFQRRRRLTPIPGYARKEIKSVANALSRRFPDIIRREGTQSWKDAISGAGRGVDLRGSSMNSFLTKKLLSDLLVIGKVGVLVDAPQVNGPSAADVPQGFRPYLKMYEVEIAKPLIPAPSTSPSDWSAVLLHDNESSIDIRSGNELGERFFRYWFLDPDRGELVTIQKLNERGDLLAEPIETQLDSIPFVLFDIQDSLMRDVCSYQITLLNMISADSNYAIDSNFPLLTRQRSNTNSGSHLKGETEDTEGGIRHGMFYERNMERPGYIAPPTGPLKLSLEFRREMKEEIRDLVTSAVMSIGEDDSIEAGLAFIGTCLSDGENRLWDHWQAYEKTNPDRRTRALIDYPDTWTMMSPEDRIKQSSDILELIQKLPTNTGQKELAKVAIDIQFRGKVTNEKLDTMRVEIDAARFTTSDPAVIKLAGELHLAGLQDLSMALGFAEDASEQGKKEQADKAAMIIAAQADAAAGAARGVPEASVDENSTREAREGEADTDAKLSDGPGVRGEGD